MTLYEKLISGGPQALAKYVAGARVQTYNAVLDLYHTPEHLKMGAEGYERAIITEFRKLTKEAQ